MNTPSRSLLPCFLAALCAFALTLQASPVADWNPADGTVTGGGIMVPDSVGGANFEGGPESGATLEESSDASEGKAIVFNGSQTKAVRTKAGVQLTIGNGSSLELSFWPETSGEAMTVFVSSGFEIRYEGDKERVAVIVYYDIEQNTGNYAQVVLDAKPGQWNKLTATISDTELTADVNGIAGRKQLLSPVKSPPAAASLGLKGTGRPFKGKIGKITLAQN